MIGKGEVKALSDLARLALSAEEMDKLHHDLESILGYVSELSNISALASDKQDLGLVKNIFRNDDSPHEPSLYTTDLLQEVPRVKNGFVEVQKILGDK